MENTIKDLIAYVQNLCSSRKNGATSGLEHTIQNPIVLLPSQLQYPRSVIAQAMIDLAQHNIKVCYFKPKGKNPERFICFTCTETPCTKQLAEDLKEFLL